jgi:hypothetical protein
MPEGRIPKLIMEMDTRGKKKKRTAKKHVDGRNTSSHDSEKLRTRSM